ncbi:hypothetical protein DMUE_4625 [Dictyocoela muelleri]|nr:hypothetical protein DMUE_4625 [Dictyocoela muelleri]
MEEIMRKKDFGTPKIQGWIERFSRFDFKVCYKEGSKMVQADALSRMFMAVSNNNEINLEEIFHNIHKKNAHRKSIKNILREQGINLSHRKLKNILSNCDVYS